MKIENNSIVNKKKYIWTEPLYLQLIVVSTYLRINFNFMILKMLLMYYHWTLCQNHLNENFKSGICLQYTQGLLSNSILSCIKNFRLYVLSKTLSFISFISKGKMVFFQCFSNFSVGKMEKVWVLFHAIHFKLEKCSPKKHFIHSNR